MKKYFRVTLPSYENVSRTTTCYKIKRFIQEFRVFSRYMTKKTVIILFVLLSNAVILPAALSQSPDWSYAPVVERPENIPAPIVLFDEGHNNFHNANVSYYGFTKQLTADGYNVRTIKGPLVDDPNIAQSSDFQHQKDLAKILVIANPCLTLPCNSLDDNAFTALEVAELRQWVEQGGSLFLIIDHPPFAQVTDLALAFGVDVIKDSFPTTVFSTANATNNALNGSSDLVLGRNLLESVSYVKSFTGAAFAINANPPLDTVFESIMSLIPDLYQGMAIKVGAGRVYLSSEAGMFTTQLDADGNPWGMHVPTAEYNEQYLRNIIHWLEGRLSVISGKVALADGSGVSGVTIEFVNQGGSVWTATTDSNGYYVSPMGVGDDTYLVTAKSDAYNFAFNGFLLSVSEKTVRQNFSAILQ